MKRSVKTSDAGRPDQRDATPVLIEGSRVRVGLAYWPEWRAIRDKLEAIDRDLEKLASRLEQVRDSPQNPAYVLGVVCAAEIKRRQLYVEKAKLLLSSKHPGVKQIGIKLLVAQLEEDYAGRLALEAKRTRVHKLTHSDRQISSGKKKNIVNHVNTLHDQGWPITKARDHAAALFKVSVTTVRGLTPTGAPRGRPKKRK